MSLSICSVLGTSRCRLTSHLEEMHHAQSQTSEDKVEPCTPKDMQVQDS